MNDEIKMLHTTKKTRWSNEEIHFIADLLDSTGIIWMRKQEVVTIAINNYQDRATSRYNQKFPDDRRNNNGVRNMMEKIVAGLHGWKTVSVGASGIKIADAMADWMRQRFINQETIY